MNKEPVSLNGLLSDESSYTRAPGSRGMRGKVALLGVGAIAAIGALTWGLSENSATEQASLSLASQPLISSSSHTEEDPNSEGLATLALAAYANNIDFFFRGYNIYTGNPNEGTKDAGIAGSIFTPTYTSGAQTGDRRYFVPDEIELARIQGCSIDSSSLVVTGETSLTNSFGISVQTEAGAEYGGFGAKFKASYSYKQKSQEINSNKKVYVSTSAECAVYEARLASYSAKPQLANDFKNGLAALEKSGDDAAAYYRFFDAFGTHYSQTMLLGARYGFTSSLTTQGYQKLLNQGVDVSVGASASYKNITVGTTTSSSWEREQSEKFSQEASKDSWITIGSLPPRDGGALAWANQAMDNPMPIKRSVRPITDLTGSLSFVSGKVSANLRKYLATYCPYLQSKAGGFQGDCSNPRGDGAFTPQRVNILFPNDIVSISVTQEQMPVRRAIDGDSTRCQWDDPRGSVATTFLRAGRYDAQVLTIDLGMGQSQFIKAIRYKAGNDHAGYLDRAVVRVGESPNFGDNPACSDTLRSGVQDQTFECNRKGRYIAFREAAGSDSRKPQFVVCEIEAYNR